MRQQNFVVCEPKFIKFFAFNMEQIKLKTPFTAC